jgi:hypothetical protein
MRLREMFMACRKQGTFSYFFHAAGGVAKSR